MRYIFSIFIYFIQLTKAFGQPLSTSDNKSKNIINKVTFYAGPSLSFNYGNKFVENYKDENVTNRRLIKPGNTLGIGISHQISKELDLFIRFQNDNKGTRNELNTPSILDGNRTVTLDDYSYRYSTFNFLPQLHIGKHKKLSLGLGFYYSRIKTIDGYSKTYETQGTYNTEGHFKGRYFYQLRDDGTRSGFAWMPFITSIKEYDFGIISSLLYTIN